MTDVFSQVVDAVRIRGSLYFRTHFVSPWSVSVPPFQRVARFHLVVKDSCWVTVDSHDPVKLDEGDLIVIPHGAPHLLADAPDRPARTLDHVVDQAGFTGVGALMYSEKGRPGADEPAANLVCGHFEYQEALLHPMLEQLPPYIVVRAAETQNHVWLNAAVRFIAHEATAGEPGGVAIVNRLSEILFIQVVRSFAARAPHQNRFLTALTDPRIGRALEAIHREPAKAWSVAALAAEAGMSRARFAERFAEILGVTPSAYLGDWRIRKAIDLLRDRKRTLTAVAHAVGFNSDRALGRVFKQIVGESPGAYRRRL